MLNTSFASWPSFSAEEADAVARVVLSNKVNYWTGTECREFEKEFAAWCGVPHAVALANGTLALDVALKALGINLDQFDTAAQHLLGTLATGVNGKMFRYVQFLDAVTYQLGDVCTIGTTGTDVWKVTNDRAGGSAVTGHAVVGVLAADGAVPTQNQYGWLQVAGECFLRGTYAAGDFVKPHASNDGEAVVSGYTAAKADFNIFAKAHSASRAMLVGLV